MWNVIVFLPCQFEKKFPTIDTLTGTEFISKTISYVLSENSEWKALFHVGCH